MHPIALVDIRKGSCPNRAISKYACLAACWVRVWWVAAYHTDTRTDLVELGAYLGLTRLRHFEKAERICRLPLRWKRIKPMEHRSMVFRKPVLSVRVVILDLLLIQPRNRRSHYHVLGAFLVSIG